MYCCKQQADINPIFQSLVNSEPKLIEFYASLSIQLEDKLTKIDLKSTPTSNRENMARNSNFTSIKKNVEVELSKLRPPKSKKHKKILQLMR